MIRNTLGTLLRVLLDHLDGDVEAFYRVQGLDFRPRFTPVVRLLADHGPASIRQIQRHTSLSHSALSQTIAEMTRRGLVSVRSGVDARQRIVSLTSAAEALLPTLRACWAATNAAAAQLSREAGSPLEPMLAAAIEAVEQRPFLDRIAENLEAARKESQTAT